MRTRAAASQNNRFAPARAIPCSGGTLGNALWLRGRTPMVSIHVESSTKSQLGEFAMEHATTRAAVVSALVDVEALRDKLNSLLADIDGTETAVDLGRQGLWTKAQISLLWSRVNHLPGVRALFEAPPNAPTRRSPSRKSFSAPDFRNVSRATNMRRSAESPASCLRRSAGRSRTVRAAPTARLARPKCSIGWTVALPRGGGTSRSSGSGWGPARGQRPAGLSGGHRPGLLITVDRHCRKQRSVGVGNEQTCVVGQRVRWGIGWGTGR